MTAVEQVKTEKGQMLIVLNPVGGHSNPDEVRQIVQETFGAADRQYSIYETTPDNDATTEAIRAALDDGCKLVVAAGGDGTVSMVADVIAGKDAQLGVLPVGTANVLALELGIPQDVRKAAELLAGEHIERQIDIMRIGEHSFILQVGIGLDSLMINDTDRQAKRRFGRLAYIGTLLAKMVGYRSQRFTLLVDGKRRRLRAFQLMVANAGTLGIPPFTWGPHITPSDGQLDLCIVKVRQPRDYLSLLRQIVTGHRQHGPHVEYIRVSEGVTISADEALPVQADGEIIGETPVQIVVVPHGIKILVPAESDPPSIVSVARKVDKKE
jgi:YegS/Rv2252/BmrU family lipid kinase